MNAQQNLRSSSLVFVLAVAAASASLVLPACSDDEASDAAAPSSNGSTATGSGGAGAEGGSAPATGTGASGGSGGDATATASSTGSGGAGGKAPVELANTSLGASCNEPNSVGPLLPGEKGHWYATRLTPTSYPVTIESVDYGLIDNASCDASLAHGVQLIVTSDTAPSPSPSVDGTLVEQATITPPALVDGTATVQHTLTNPITLSQGESLVVAVEMEADLLSNRAVCLQICEDTQKATFDYWSNAAPEPYAWDDLVTVFGILANSTVRAHGHE